MKTHQIPQKTSMSSALGATVVAATSTYMRRGEDPNTSQRVSASFIIFRFTRYLFLYMSVFLMLNGDVARLSVLGKRIFASCLVNGPCQ